DGGGGLAARGASHGGTQRALVRCCLEGRQAALEKSPLQRRLPGAEADGGVALPEQGLRRGRGLAEERRHDLQRRPASPQRADHWLDERDGAVVRSRVAPLLEGVQAGEDEVAE